MVLQKKKERKEEKKKNVARKGIYVQAYNSLQRLFFNEKHENGHVEVGKNMQFY